MPKKGDSKKCQREGDYKKEHKPIKSEKWSQNSTNSELKKLNYEEKRQKMREKRLQVAPKPSKK